MKLADIDKIDLAGLPKQLLGAAGALYGQITTLRNACYDRRLLKTHWLSAPVIAVGNLTTGGTGKTPTVIFLAKMIESLGHRPGVILRGYGSKAGVDADEVLLLRRHLPGVPIVANPDRIEGGQLAIAQGAEVIIADDAYQHRRLGRDLNLCLVDAIFPFGGERMLPAGRLRESMIGFSRADLAILTRCDQSEASRPAEIEAKIRRYAPNLPILRSSHQASHYEDFSGMEFDIERLRWKKVFAWAGIGQPEAFFETLRRLGAELVGTRRFRDHYRFTADDLRTLGTQARSAGAELLVCTEKDIVKIDEDLFRSAEIERANMVALKIEIALSSEYETILRNRIERLLKEFPQQVLRKLS